jgi:hypothetical protein
MMWIGTRVGPLYVGRRIGGGQSADPQSEGAKRLIAVYFLLILVTFFTVPVVTAVLIVGFPIMFIAAMIMEVRHRADVAEEAVSGVKTVRTANPGRLGNAGGPGFWEARADMLRAKHLAGRKITNQAKTVIRKRPDLEYVIYPERRPVDPFPFFSEQDREWFSRFGNIPEAQ